MTCNFDVPCVLAQQTNPLDPNGPSISIQSCNYFTESTCNGSCGTGICDRTGDTTKYVATVDGVATNASTSTGFLDHNYACYPLAATQTTCAFNETTLGLVTGSGQNLCPVACTCYDANWTILVASVIGQKCAMFLSLDDCSSNCSRACVQTAPTVYTQVVGSDPATVVTESGYQAYTYYCPQPTPPAPSSE